MTGFEQPSRVIPASVLLSLLRDTWNPIEIKVVLAVAALGGLEIPVRQSDVLGEPEIVAGSRSDGSSRSPAERIAVAIEAASARGSLIALRDADDQTWFLLGTAANQRRVRNGRMAVEDNDLDIPIQLELSRPNVFGLYEQNIGLVTPLVADRLADAIDQYPESWIEDAIGEAVAYNRRSWRYIERILMNWSTEGRTDATHQRHPERDGASKESLRDKYARYLKRD